jgi:hypothetical protein
MQQLHVPPPSTIGLILAASDISGLTVLGELPDSVLRFMALPERVTNVQANNTVMFHEAAEMDKRKNRTQKNPVRQDTSTYQWAGKCARAVVKNPSWYLAGNKLHTYQLIGSVEPPNALYPTIRYMRLILKYVSSTRAHAHAPEIWLSTYIPQSHETIKNALKKATVIPPN